MENDNSTIGQIVCALTDIFTRIIQNSTDIASFECEAIDLCHRCLANAMGRAIEAYDDILLEKRPQGLYVHDKRSRTIATEIGDVSFMQRRYRDKYGCDVYLLSDVLDIPYNARISPSATEFLVLAGSQVSYAKAAKLMSRHGSDIDSRSVMNVIHRTGDICAKDDAQSALALYKDGLIPDAEIKTEDICMEADGTYFSVQKPKEGEPKRVEVKAMCAYSGKSIEGKKVRRNNVFHHACVGTPTDLWAEAIPQMGKKFDLSALKHVHLGGDGEAWCADAETYLPNTSVQFHLDPFHVNKAISSCFYDQRLASKVIAIVTSGEIDCAIKLLKACIAFGIAREKKTKATITYLENNKDAIAKVGPSLGTMESDNQHLYGARMDAVPCAWSIHGASAMARIISRRESNREILRLTRKDSISQKRKESKEKKILKFLERQGGSRCVIKSIGSGYLPPHQVDTKKMAGGNAYALYKGMANLDRWI